LAVPAGIAGFFLLKLLLVLFGNLPRRERWLPIIAALAVSLTSGMAIAVLGTTMNEWPGTALTIAALYLIVRAVAHVPDGRLPRGALLAAGLLCGLATGAKLTFGVFAVGLCMAILLRGPWRSGYFRGAFIDAFQFGVAVLAGTAITGGPWMWALWTHFANPIFPYGNIWFKSPWWGEYEVMGRQYGPHTLTEWLLFPFRMMSPQPFFVTEQTYTDARLSTLYALALIAVAAWIGQRISARARGSSTTRTNFAAMSPTWRVVGLFWIVSFLIWAAQFSIYRYLVPLEMLTGALLVAMLRYVVRPGAVAPAIVLVSIALMATTVPPDWWRKDFGRRWVDVKVPEVLPGALILLTTDAPMAYVLPSFPADARHFGLNNNINDPQRDTLMEATIARAVRDHRGPMYSLAHPAGGGADVLAAHKLVRLPGLCQEVRTNMRTSPLELCRLTRIPE